MRSDHTAHVDRINLVAFRVHLVHDMSGLQRDSLNKSALQLFSSAVPHFRTPKDEVITSSVTLNFRARSFRLSSRAMPVIMPFIFGSASGERLPGRGQSYPEPLLPNHTAKRLEPISHHATLLNTLSASHPSNCQYLRDRDRNAGPLLGELMHISKIQKVSDV